MVIFRENTEDIYAGIEWLTGTPEAKKVIDFLQKEMGVNKIRFPNSSSIGIKPISKEGSERLIRAAMRYAIENDRRNVTLVHKGNIQKFTEGMFMKWGYALAKREFSDRLVSWDECGGKPPAGKILVKDAITDAFLQQILTRPDEFDVIPCCNLTGDLISDALAAQVGGIGIAPGGNINYETGHALFEATHGTAPKYAGQDKVNPGSVILSGEMMLRYMGWTEAADRIITRPRGHDRPEGGDLRLRPPDGGREGGQVLGVRHAPSSRTWPSCRRTIRRRCRWARQKAERDDSSPKITVVGAGNVGATVGAVHRREGAGDVVLSDVVEGMPQGKALDLAQAGPVHGYDCASRQPTATSETARLRHRRHHRRARPEAGDEPRRPPVQERRDRRRRWPSRSWRARRTRSSSSSPTRSTRWCSSRAKSRASPSSASSAWPACSTPRASGRSSPRSSTSRSRT